MTTFNKKYSCQCIAHDLVQPSPWKLTYLWFSSTSINDHLSKYCHLMLELYQAGNSVDCNYSITRVCGVYYTDGSWRRVCEPNGFLLKNSLTFPL